MAKLLHRGNREAIQGVANFSNYAINGLGLLFFKNKPEDNILLLLAHERVWEKNDFFNSLKSFETTLIHLKRERKNIEEFYGIWLGGYSL